MNQVALRESLTPEQQATWQGTLIEDDRRRRPLYFDGRFLTARDLVRDQDYFLTRQTDLARAGGHGIVDGLRVSVSGQSDSELLVSSGHGVTTQGEVCAITEQLTINLTNIPTMQRLDSTFGLLDVPREPSRNLTGLYVLALRAVEYTASPISAYPTEVNGAASQHDSEIIEAVVAVLIEWSRIGSVQDHHRQRSAAARQVFLDGAGDVPAPGTLPLAMVSLVQNRVHWIDEFLVRREVGAERSDLLGLGLTSRAAREACIQQFNRQLDELMAENPGPVTAAEFFSVLPPVGRMPTTSVSSEFTQVFFPAEVSVELTLIPQDELAQLVEEALNLPPIDLTLNGEELAGTDVTVFVPVPRAEFRTRAAQLRTVTRQLKTASPGLISRRSPLEQLLNLGSSERSRAEPDGNAGLITEAWRSLLGSVSTLWYARRHNVPWEVSLVDVRLERNPSGEKPPNEKPSGEKPSGQKPSGEKPSDEKPSGEKPSGEKPSGEKPSGEKPSGEEPSGEQPSGEKPSGEKPSDEKPSGEKPSGEKPTDEKPSGEQPPGEKPVEGGTPIISIKPGLSQSDAMYAVFDAFDLGKDARTRIDGSQAAGGLLTQSTGSRTSADNLFKQVAGSERFVEAPSLVIELYYQMLAYAAAQSDNRISKSEMERFLGSAGYSKDEDMGLGLLAVQRSHRDFRDLLVHRILGEANVASIVDRQARNRMRTQPKSLPGYAAAVLKAVGRVRQNFEPGSQKTAVLDPLREEISALQ